MRKALIEREFILEIAPHLAKPIRLVLPHSPLLRPRWMIRLGLLFYDHLGARRRIPSTSAVDLRTMPEGDPLKKQFKSAFAYWDVWIDDSRLVVANALDAKRRGANILRSTKLVGARRNGKFWKAELANAATGEKTAIRAKVLFNGAGPWVENALGTTQGVSGNYRIRLVKGSHLVMKKWWKGDFAYVLQADDGRIIFVNPYFDGLALVGTTDIPFKGRPEDAAVDDFEVAYLLDILNQYFKADLGRSDIVQSYSGVRPLFDDESGKDASKVTRDYVLEIDAAAGNAPLLTAYGGKLTTYRKLAEDSMDKLAPYFPRMTGPWTGSAPLPGGDMPNSDLEAWLGGFRSSGPWLRADLARHYGLCYGTDAEEMLDGAESINCLGRHFGGLLYEREASWLMEREWARAPDDVLFRRTKHGLFLSSGEKEAFATWMS